MQDLNSRWISFWSILIFTASLLIGFAFKDYKLAVSGFIILIILTAFMPGWHSTLAAGIISMLIMTAMVVYFKPLEADLMET